MSNAIPRILSVFIMLSSISALFGAAFDPSSIKKDPNFFYGFGTAKTAQEAQQIAFSELISDALTQTRTATPSIPGKVAITSEIAKSFVIKDFQPFLSQNESGIFAIGYRIHKDDWLKIEAPRQNSLRTDLNAQFKTLMQNTEKALYDRLVDGGTLLTRLANTGLYDVLADAEGSATLLSTRVETFYTGLVGDLKLSLSPENGLVHSATVFTETVSYTNGAPLAAFPLQFVWRTSKKAAPAVKVATDDAGKAVIAYPTDATFKNRAVWLKIGTNFSAQVPGSRFLVNLDKTTSREYPFRQLDAIANMGANEVAISAGPFQAGLLKHDRRASATKEKPRAVKLAAFAIDRLPVTNAFFGAYLDDAKVPESDYPDYWDNPDYNQPDQPVIGISWDDANKFAAWLSSRLGYTKRLPTEDEYERAARGGQQFIYPWGDQPPTDGVRGNYAGNKRFDAPSPVGSFENGKNPLGLLDMAGNVWEWTATSPDTNMTDDPAWKVVKGGSWMDGPSELRVSNRRALDPAQRYQDTGFRLVREVTP